MLVHVTDEITVRFTVYSDHLFSENQIERIENELPYECFAKNGEVEITITTQEPSYIVERMIDEVKAQIKRILE